MRNPDSTPSLVPSVDLSVYIVLDDFGQAGRAYRETDEAEADLENVIDNMMTGQYRDPLRVVGFNTSEGWSRDVSEDIAWELRTEGKSIPQETRQFLEWHVGENEVAMAEHFAI
jgi:hypothetical protein